MILILMILIILFVIYVIIDNYSVKVIKNDIYIENLPGEFNGYKILQLTDLHSKDFGTTLYDKINELDYDIILFTGDMMNDNDYNMKNFRKLIDNINKKDILIYIDGNNGPKTYDSNFKITKFGTEVQALGCTLIKDIICIEKNNSKIYLSNFDNATNMFYYGKINENIKQNFKEINDCISIGVGHEPANKDILKYISMHKNKYYKYDLIIAGHYHGGQIRIPFYGALFVPARSSKESFLPDQKNVSGIYKYDRVIQYVSRGLGSSRRIPILNFRLFNTPQIDVLTLVKNKFISN